MKKIYKYTLIPNMEVQFVAIPKKRKWLCAEIQGGKICLWAEVELAKITMSPKLAKQHQVTQHVSILLVLVVMFTLV